MTKVVDNDKNGAIMELSLEMEIIERSEKWQ